MKGRDLLRSALRETTARPCCWDGAKAEAEPARRAATMAANFIMFNFKQREMSPKRERRCALEQERDQQTLQFKGGNRYEPRCSEL